MKMKSTPFYNKEEWILLFAHLIFHFCAHSLANNWFLILKSGFFPVAFLVSKKKLRMDQQIYVRLVQTIVFFKNLLRFILQAFHLKNPQ